MDNVFDKCLLKTETVEQIIQKNKVLLSPERDGALETKLKEFEEDKHTVSEELHALPSRSVKQETHETDEILKILYKDTRRMNRNEEVVYLDRDYECNCAYIGASPGDLETDKRMMKNRYYNSNNGCH